MSQYVMEMSQSLLGTCIFPAYFQTFVMSNDTKKPFNIYKYENQFLNLTARKRLRMERQF